MAAAAATAVDPSATAVAVEVCRGWSSDSEQLQPSVATLASSRHHASVSALALYSQVDLYSQLRNGNCASRRMSHSVYARRKVAISTSLYTARKLGHCAQCWTPCLQVDLKKRKARRWIEYSISRFLGDAPTNIWKPCSSIVTTADCGGISRGRTHQICGPWQSTSVAIR